MRTANTRLFDAVELATDQVSASFNIERLEHFGAVATWTNTTPAADTFAPEDVILAADQIIIATNAFVADLPVQLTTTGTLPGGLALATTYYVQVVDADRFQLALTAGGAAVDITDAGSGTHTITPIAAAPTFGLGDVFVLGDELKVTAHGYVDNLPVKITTTGTLPAGISAGVTYYLLGLNVDQLHLYDAPGGSLIDITDRGTGTHTIEPVDYAPTFGPAAVFPTANIIVITAHGYEANLPVQLTTTGTLPTGLALVTTYYVDVVTVDQIRLLDAPSGSVVTFSDVGSGTHTVEPATAAPTFTAKEVYTLGDELVLTAHGYVDDLPVQLTTTGTLPAGLALVTTYYVKVVTVDHIQLAATPAGAAIDITDEGTGTHTVEPVVAAPTFGPEDVAPTGDEFYEASHELVTDLPVQLTTTDTLPAPLLLATTYYAKKNDANRFSLAATPAGAAIDLTDRGVGTHTITPVAYAPTFETTDVDVGNDMIYEGSHSFVEDEEVQFTTTGTLPAGLSLATPYYVLVQDVDRIKVSATVGGAAVNITDVGTGTHTATRQAAAPSVAAAEVFPMADSLYMAAHGLVDAEEVQFTTATTLPAGLSLATPYYVIVADANSIQVEASVGGGVVNITDGGTGTHTATRQSGNDTVEQVGTTADSVRAATHGLVAAEEVVLTTTGTLPAGLALATTYYVLVVDANHLQLEASIGGGAIDITDGGSGTHTATRQAANGAGEDYGLVANSIRLTGHTLVEDEPVVLSTAGTLPAGLSPGTYYVIKTDANTIQVEASVGGGAIDITDNGTGTHTATRSSPDQAVEEVGPTPNSIRMTAHGLVANEPVALTTTDTLPAGLTVATWYVLVTDVDTVQLESSVGAGAVDITDNGTGTHTATRNTAADDMEDVGYVAEQIHLPAHGLVDAQIVQLSTTGALPTGLSASTDYYVIVDDANYIRLASSRANALAGTAINITGEGTGTHTLTPSSLSTGITVQYANTETPVEADWVDSALTLTMDDDPLIGLIAGTNVGFRHLRLKTTSSGGSGALTVDINAKGGT